MSSDQTSAPFHWHPNEVRYCALEILRATGFSEEGIVAKIERDDLTWRNALKDAETVLRAAEEIRTAKDTAVELWKQRIVA